jgi:CRP/FNR family transcriptional regulator, cyclic AMP receptor protein
MVSRAGPEHAEAARPFADLVGDSVLEWLRSRGTRRPVRAGEVLFLEGEHTDDVLLLESGLVKVYVTAPGGAELILGLYGAGELLGEMSAVGWGDRSASATGHTPGTAIQLRGRQFRAFLQQHPAALVHVLGVVQQRLRRADQERLSYLADDVAGRVARRLLSWAKVHGQARANGAVAVLDMSRKELAQSIAASEKHVDAVLTAMRCAGLITTGRRLFVLVDPERLHHWAEHRRPR